MSTKNREKLAGLGEEGSSQKVARQGFIVSFMTFFSRVSGLIRDIALSYVFGASAMADIFFVAFRIPNFFRRLFAEGAFNQAFIPVMVEFKAKGREELKIFLSSVSGLFGALLIIFVFLGLIGSDLLVKLFAPGFMSDPDKLSQTSDLVRIMFPYIGFISLTAYAGGVLNAHDRFAVPAITPVLLNLCLIIASLLWIWEVFDGLAVVVLAWAVLLAGLAQLAFQIPSLGALGLLVKPNLNYRHSGVKEMGVLILPAIFASSVGQINALVNTVIASNLVEGSISWLYYADRLLELPVGMVAIALSTVMLPHLSRLSAGGSEDGFSSLMNWGVLMGLGLGLPAGIGLYILSVPLLSVLFMSFEGGAMTGYDVRMAGLALEMFAIALPGFVLVRVLSSGFFAKKNTKQPFRYASAAVAVNLFVSLATFKALGHVGLALATALSAWTNVFLLYFGLIKHKIAVIKVVTPQLVKVYLLCLLMALGLGIWSPEDLIWLSQDPLYRLAKLLIAILVVLGLYLVALFGLGFRGRDLRPGV